VDQAAVVTLIIPSFIPFRPTHPVALSEVNPMEAANRLAAVNSLRAIGINEIVIVDATCDRYGDFVQAAQAGEVGVHFCVDGRSAVRLSRRFRADAWLVASELPDMSGFDLVDMLSPHVLQGGVDPLLSGSRVSLDDVGHGARSGIFIVSDTYRVEEEQRALASGVAGYLVRPITLDVIRATRVSAAIEEVPSDA
jgi:CheY-like chemotaxis protein